MQLLSYLDSNLKCNHLSYKCKRTVFSLQAVKKQIAGGIGLNGARIVVCLQCIADLTKALSVLFYGSFQRTSWWGFFLTPNVLQAGGFKLILVGLGLNQLQHGKSHILGRSLVLGKLGWLDTLALKFLFMFLAFV